MILLTETKKLKNKRIYELIDKYNYQAKNLYNACNYIIKQVSRISYKLKKDEILEDWEQELLDNINKSIETYNHSGRKEKNQKQIDKNNGYIADMYFLSWYLKDSKEYKDMPYATCSQIVIQSLCSNWKGYYKAIKDYRKNTNKYLGKPEPPKYLDKNKGRYWIVLTKQNMKVKEGRLYLPKIFEDIVVKTDKENIQQIRLKVTETRKTVVEIIYRVKEVQEKQDNGKVMSIDLGLNNLATLTFNTEATPLIINGRPLKSINQYYNKKLAKLRSQDETIHYTTKAMSRLTERRNHKVKDYLHKASRKIIDIAMKEDLTCIIIGKNDGWKQKVELGKKTNQSFVGVPFNQLIDMIKYKAFLQGIRVEEQEESYTSGTSYIDGEQPKKENYDKSRRKKRGLFRSNVGIYINADVNGSYQIMRKKISLKYKGYEKVEKLKVA